MVVTASMCKASPPSPPSTEVADEIKNTTVVDSSWSFINIHLPSAVTTTIVIIIILIAAWTLLRIYSRFSKARQPTDQTRPGPGPATLTPATWPSAPPAPTWPSTTPPTRTSTSLTLDMDTLIKALKPDSTPAVQASGPPPNLAHLS